MMVKSQRKDSSMKKKPDPLTESTLKPDMIHPDWRDPMTDLPVQENIESGFTTWMRIHSAEVDLYEFLGALETFDAYLLAENIITPEKERENNAAVDRLMSKYLDGDSGLDSKRDYYKNYQFENKEIKWE
tara:strand:- start:2680 stop:3069 length:390 start_codon:yes stop_codon:yes gene_type:complete